MTSVTACLITKNEAVHLGNCLSSLSGQVDEVIVVDTGSMDETVSIAERFGARLYHFPWRHDFSAARNHGLDRVRTEWALYIDADECLSCRGGATLKSLMRSPGAAAARVMLRPRLDTTAYAEHRLFRSDPRIRFAGAMHETIIPGVRSVARQDGRVIEDCFEILITHYGYEGDQSAKHERNLPLLNGSVQNDPKRVYLRYHLGQTLWAVGRADEAVQQLSTGLECAAASTSEQSRVEGSMCAQILADMRVEAGELAGALEVAETGLALFPDNLLLQLVRARCLVALGCEGEAVRILSRMLEHDPESFFDPRIAYQKSLFGADTVGLLGAAEFKRGNYDCAEQHFLRAAELAESPLEYRAKATLARARAEAAGARRGQACTT